MALQLSDIFPLCPIQGTTANAKILEPHKCSKTVVSPTQLSESAARVIFRKRISRPYVEFNYEYEGILQYEYELIASFYRRMKGKYNEFYLVDWSTPYQIEAITNSSITLYSVLDLEASTGYAGNTLLIYNGKITDGLNKQILTIDNTEDFSDYTISVDQTQTINSNLQTTTAFVYVLYPCIFKTDKLSPSVKDFCVEKKVVTIQGHGKRTIFGQVMDVGVSFTLLGSINA
jgi:hypothetical protein